MTGQPKDHLAPGGARRGDDDASNPRESEQGSDVTTPNPADPGAVPGSTGAAARGKATRSPDEVATRPHLEGAEQGPM
jgi:hypothetical protein